MNYWAANDAPEISWEDHIRNLPLEQVNDFFLEAVLMLNEREKQGRSREIVRAAFDRIADPSIRDLAIKFAISTTIECNTGEDDSSDDGDLNEEEQRIRDELAVARSNHKGPWFFSVLECILRISDGRIVNLTAEDFRHGPEYAMLCAYYERPELRYFVAEAAARRGTIEELETMFFEGEFFDHVRTFQSALAVGHDSAALQVQAISLTPEMRQSLNDSISQAYRDILLDFEEALEKARLFQQKVPREIVLKIARFLFRAEISADLFRGYAIAYLDETFSQDSFLRAVRLAEADP